MSLETRVLFPLSRGVYCVVGAILLVVFFVSLVYAFTVFLGSRMVSVASAGQPPVLTIRPQEILDQMRPFGTATAPASSIGPSSQVPGSSPFGRAMSPQEEFARDFPGADTSRMIELLGGPTFATKENIETLSRRIAAAVEAGDSAPQYVSNANEVMAASKADMRWQTLDLYHAQRMSRLEKLAEYNRQLEAAEKLAEVERSLNAAKALAALIVAGFSLLLLVQVSLLLSLFAIERNTRVLTLQGE